MEGGQNVKNPSKTDNFKIGMSSIIDIKLNNLYFHLVKYTAHKLLDSSLTLKIEELEVLDNMPTSVWNKFLTIQKSDEALKRRQSGEKTIETRIDVVKKQPGIPDEEWRIKVLLLGHISSK